MRPEFLWISVLRVASGPRVKLAGCKSALTPPPAPLIIISGAYCGESLIRLHLILAQSAQHSR